MLVLSIQRYVDFLGPFYPLFTINKTEKAFSPSCHGRQNKNVPLDFLVNDKAHFDYFNFR